MERKKTIADIAAKCGVSIMTVSRALRSNTSVKDETRLKILEAARRSGYLHDIKKGRPVSSKNAAKSTVEIVLGLKGKNVANFYSELMMSIERSLASNGMDCVIRTYDGDYENFLKLRDSIRNSHASSVLFTGYFKSEELKALLDVAHAPLLLDNPGFDFSGISCDSISFDNVAAAMLGVGHLIEIKRRKILLLKGYPEHYFSMEIEEGYRKSLKVYKIPLDDKYIACADFTVAGARRKINELLDGGLKFDAVFTNDEMACGVYQALYERNLKIPADIAVCGCDGLASGLNIFPELTTVSLDYSEMGKRAVEHLLNGKSYSSVLKIKLMPSLCVRKSTSKK